MIEESLIFRNRLNKVNYLSKAKFPHFHLTSLAEKDTFTFINKNVCTPASRTNS